MRKALVALSFLALAGCIEDGAGGFGSSRPVYQPSYQSAAREDPPIRIIEARYGTDRRSCDATRALRRRCEGESDCSFKVGNELCGDPVAGQVKTLWVTYRCRGRVHNVSRTEGKQLGLDCD